MLNDDEKNRLASDIAAQVIAQVEAHKKNFWIEPEDHYRSHQQIEELLSIFNNAKSTIWKTLVGLFIAGVLVLAAMGIKR